MLFTRLNLELLEARVLLASPVSLTPIVNNSIINPVSGLTSPLLNPVLGSIVNPLLSSSLPGSLVSPLVGPVIGSLPQALLTVPLGSVTSLPSAIPLPSLLRLNPSNLFQPRSISAGANASPGASGFGGTQYSASSPSGAYYSAPSHEPTYRGGAGEVSKPTTWETDSSSGVRTSEGGDGIVTVGLGDDEGPPTLAGFQEVMLAFDDDLSMPNLAASLLTGLQPRASLLPQRDSQVAPVATLLNDDANDMLSGTEVHEPGRLDDLLINPAANYPGDPSLRIPSGEDKKESVPAVNRSSMRPAKEKGKSSITDVLMFGFVTAMMTLQPSARGKQIQEKGGASARSLDDLTL
jgi:hypothetical protein